MIYEPCQVEAAIEFLREAVVLMNRGSLEDVMTHNLSSHIYRMFPDRPRWAQRHIEGGQAGVQFARDGETRRGFIDNLLDSTAIEYESNLTIQAKFDRGYGQVKDYCAGLLNDGYEQDMIVGVLSDTIHWRAYRIASVTRPVIGMLGRENLELEEVEQMDGSSADETAATRILIFLTRHLARVGGRPLSAISIATDFGFDSRFCSVHINSMHNLVERAFDANPNYGSLIEDVWKRFVSFVGARELAGTFERSEYADELYLVTLGKLICANVLEKNPLFSDRMQIESIIKGDFFRDKGLSNLVEYDYFGWLHKPPFLNAIVDVAAEMQEDLCAYDFGNAPSEDLFGQMLVQLANRAQRLLLGQASTPRWLARELVRTVINSIPTNETPRLVDMCCGSGAFVVEAVLEAKNRIAASIAEDDQARRVQELALAITGFDIDPLAVILAKIGWVLAAHDWLEPYGAFQVSIPIYHADALFAITPLSDTVEDEDSQQFHSLRIADITLQLPRFLISPDFQGAFDSIIDIGYELAISAGSRPVRVSDTALDSAVSFALAGAAHTATGAETQSAKVFLKRFVEAVDRLRRDGRNGIWAFIMRNSYRPGLVAGHFNGLVSNPPWLALSRIADNPYKRVLQHKAEQFSITPPGPSFLHIEMATIFLLHAVDRYLHEGARVACIVPDSVLTGYNHNPFRNAAYVSSMRAVHFRIEEVWRISETTFKNRGAVLIGSKNLPEITPSPTFPGFLIDESGMTPLTMYHNLQGPRSSWSAEPAPTGVFGLFRTADFRQGADIMPRTLFFHDLSPAPPSRGRVQWQVRPIDIRTSPVAFVIKDAKKLKNFRLRACVLPEEVLFQVLTSNLLTPFDLAAPLSALLPIRKNTASEWEPMDESDIAALGLAVADAFRQICAAIGHAATIADIWDLIDTRGKLSQQQITRDQYLVLTGTSGELVCSAFVQTNALGRDRLVIDQTLNWVCVETREEALYLSGLLNSEAINDVIREFQPEGRFGKRHIHSLPYRVTPPFDPSQALHQDIVSQTQRLVDEYNAAKTTGSRLPGFLNPNRGTLAQRRLRIKRMIEQLPAFQGYSEICRALYGV